MNKKYTVGDRVIAQGNAGVITEVTPSEWYRIMFDKPVRNTANYWGDWELKPETTPDTKES